MTLGEAIKEVRGDLLQGELAEKIGVRDQTRISDWEKDKVRPSLELLAAIEDACDQPRGYILALAGYVEEEATQAAAKGGKGQLPADEDPRKRTR